jgi:chromosome segregation ATPase
VLTIEERVAFVEGRVVEQSNMFDAVRTDIALLRERMERGFEAFDQRMDRRFEAIDQRFVGADQRFISIDERFNRVDRQFDRVDQRFDRVDQRFDALEQKVDRKIDTLDAKLSRHFMWLAGILVTTLAALTAAVLAR